MNEAQVVRAIHDFFHKEVGAQAQKTFCAECWREAFGGRADLVFIQSRSDVIHAVEAKSTLEGSFDVVEQVQRYPANDRWIALPANEYVPREGFLKACSGEGIGVSVVHGRVRKTIQVKRWPAYQPGDFLSEWPRLEGEWYGAE